MEPDPETLWVKRCPSEERDAQPNLLIDDHILQFLGGVWPPIGEDAETFNDSDDEVITPKKRKLEPNEGENTQNPVSDNSVSDIVPTHFLECSSSSVNEEEGESHPGPMAVFETVFPTSILDVLVSCTNQVAEILKISLKKKHNLFLMWKPLTETEFKVFLGLLYHMENIKLPKVKDYWNRSRLYSIPIFEKMMPRNRFITILKALSFNTIVPDARTERELNEKDKLHPLRPLIDHFNNILYGIPCPGVLAIEEALANFKENTLFQNISWHRRIGVFILQMLLKLSWLIFCDQADENNRLNFQKFRMKIVDGLLPSVYPTQDITAFPDINADKPHYMSYIGMNDKGKKRRKRCKYCMEMKNKRKESYFCCIGCNNHPGFCIDGCFAKFHGYS